MKQDTVFVFDSTFGLCLSVLISLRQCRCAIMKANEAKETKRSWEEKKMNARESPNTYAPLLLPAVGLALSVLEP